MLKSRKRKNCPPGCVKKPTRKTSRKRGSVKRKASRKMSRKKRRVKKKASRKMSRKKRRVKKKASRKMSRKMSRKKRRVKKKASRKMSRKKRRVKKKASRKMSRKKRKSAKRKRGTRKSSYKFKMTVGELKDEVNNGVDEIILELRSSITNIDNKKLRDHTKKSQRKLLDLLRQVNKLEIPEVDEQGRRRRKRIKAQIKMKFLERVKPELQRLGDEVRAKAATENARRQRQRRETKIESNEFMKNKKPVNRQDGDRRSRAIKDYEEYAGNIGGRYG